VRFFFPAKSSDAKLSCASILSPPNQGHSVPCSTLLFRNSLNQCQKRPLAVSIWRRNSSLRASVVCRSFKDFVYQSGSYFPCWDALATAPQERLAELVATGLTRTWTTYGWGETITITRHRPPRAETGRGIFHPSGQGKRSRAQAGFSGTREAALERRLRSATTLLASYQPRGLCLKISDGGQSWADDAVTPR